MTRSEMKFIDSKLIFDILARKTQLMSNAIPDAILHTINGRIIPTYRGRP